jgi:hypothetical protein
VFKLATPYGSISEALLGLWDRARNMEETILGLIAKKGYPATLDAPIFEPAKG